MSFDYAVEFSFKWSIYFNCTIFFETQLFYINDFNENQIHKQRQATQLGQK